MTATNKKPTAATVGLSQHFQQIDFTRAGARQQYARDKVTEARDRLRDVIIATGLPTFQGVAILAAAKMFAKATTMAVSAALSDDSVQNDAAKCGKAESL